MRCLPLLVLCALTTSASAQGLPAEAWSGGGPAGDTGADVATNFYSGTIAVVGTFKESATFGSVSVTDPASGCVFSSCHDAYLVVYAPDGTALWARRMGTPIHNDFAEGVAIAGDGTVYVSGYFTGEATWEGGDNPDATLTTRNDFDAFLARYSADGDLLWVIQGGGADQDTGRGIAVDGEGNAYWTGYFYGTATFGEGEDAVTISSQGSSDGFVAKVSPDGSLAWIVQVEGAGSADLYDAATDPYSYDRVSVVGSFTDVATIGAQSLQSRGDDDLIVAQLDAETGDVLWVEQLGGSGDDHGRGVAVSFGGWVYVAGWFNGQILVGSDVLTSAGFSDALLAAFDANGTPTWGHRVGGSTFDIGEDVAFVAPQLVSTLGEPVFSPAVALAGYVDGEITVSTPDGDLAQSAQGRDGFVAAYRATVDQDEWVEVELREFSLIGGASQDAAYGVSATQSFRYQPPPDGSSPSLYAVTAGTFNSTASVFGTEVTTAGSSDMFVGRLATCPAIVCMLTDTETAPDPDGLALTLSSHPITGPATLTLSTTTASGATVDILDATGRRIARLADGVGGAGERVFSLPQLSPGFYVAWASDGERRVSRPFVVAR